MESILKKYINQEIGINGGATSQRILSAKLISVNDTYFTIEENDLIHYCAIKSIIQITDFSNTKLKKHGFFNRKRYRAIIRIAKPGEHVIY